MNYREAENYILSLGNEVETMKLGLENIRVLLRALGDPQRSYLKVQVAGTNGKGSVCAFLDSICRAAGLRTGLFTSPHLISITERIRIDGEDISEDDFARLATQVRECIDDLLAAGQMEHRPTYFEHVTAMALLAFGETNVDIAILETGLGGRYDAVTAAAAEIAAITRIGLDHQEYLGETIEEIAAEKAAIIDTAQDVVVGRQSAAAMDVLREKCRTLELEPVTGEGEFDWILKPGEKPGLAKLETSLIIYPEFELGLKGRHQIENAQTAVSVSQVLKYSGSSRIPFDEFDNAVFAGLQSARHPGRLEYAGKFLLDGAHNAGGMQALAAYLDEFEPRPITLIFGAMRDKEVAEMAEIIFPRVRQIILTRPQNTRAMSPAAIASATGYREPILTESTAEAVERAMKVVVPDEIILVAGSLYLVGEVKGILRSQI